MTTSSNPSNLNKVAKSLTQDVVALSKNEVRKIEVVDTDIVITTQSGKKIVIRDAALRSMMNPEYMLKFNDLEVNGQAVLQNAHNFSVDAVANLTGRNTSTADEPEAPQSSFAPKGLSNAEPEVGQAKAQTAVVETKPAEPPAKDAASLNVKTTPEGAAATGDVVVRTAEAQAVAETVVAATTKAEAASSSGFFANINPAWGALGALGAAGGGGGKSVTTVISGGAGGQSTTTAVTTLVKAILNVVLGEVNGPLKYEIKGADGEVIASGTTTANDAGVIALDIKTSYSGPVEVTISDANLADNLGYKDETTGLSKNLENSVRALAVLNPDANNVINITPLTELATRWAYDTKGGNTSLGKLTSDAVTQANTKVAQAVNLVSTDGTVVDIVATSGLNALNDSTAPSGPAATLYAQVLASLSGYDNKANGSFSKTLNELNAAILTLPEGSPTNTTVGNILTYGATKAMAAMVESGTTSATVAREFLNTLYTKYPSATPVASILLDNTNQWIQKGSNTLLLNFTKTQTAENILDYLLIEGVTARRFGIQSSDLKLVTGTTNSSSTSKQWALTLKGDLASVQSDTDRKLTFKYDNTTNSMSSSELTVEVGAINPTIISSGTLGSRGTLTPTYFVESQEGLKAVTATLTDANNLTHIYKLTSSESKPTTYSYTVKAGDELPPGAVTVKITLEDKYGNVSQNVTGTGFKLVAAPTFNLLAGDDTGWINGHDAAGNSTYDTLSLSDLKTAKNSFTYVVNTYENARVYIQLSPTDGFYEAPDISGTGHYQFEFQEVDDGLYSPTIRIVDPLNNNSVETITGRAVTVDTIEPALRTNLGSFKEIVGQQDKSTLITLPLVDTDPPLGKSPKAITFWDALTGPDASYFRWVDATHKKLIFTQDNFEDKSSYTISLTAYDDVGNAKTQNYTVTVTNTNEQPTLTSAISANLTEDDATGVNGTVTLDLTQGIDDPDLALAGNDTLSVDMSNAVFTKNGEVIQSLPQGVFDLSIQNHQLKVNTSHSSLQPMIASEHVTYTISYVVKDSGGLWVNQTATVVITGQDDPTKGTLVVNGTAKEGLSLTADVSGISDADGDLQWTYQWQWKNGSNWESLGTASSSTSTLFIEKGWAGRTLKLIATTTDRAGTSTPFEKEFASVLSNDRPVVSLSGVTTGQEPVFAEGGLAVQVDGGLNLSDLNGDLISEAVVQITDFRAGDVLGFTPATGITGTYDRTTGKLSFTSTTPLNIGIYKTLLQSVTYSSTSDDPTGNQSVAAGVVGAVAQGTRTISWTVKDLLGDANAVVPSSTVKITPINDAPTITVDTPVELKEDVKTQSSANYQLADVDGLASIDIGTMTGTDSTYGKWSLSTDGKKLTKAGSFGSVELDLEGKTLTYTLDNNKAETQALTANDRRAESFKVSVKDDQGQPASPAEVVFTVLGARDPINFALMSNAVTFTEMAGADTGANAVKIASGVTVKGDDVIQQLALTWVPLSGDQLWLNGVDLLSPMTDLSAGFTVGGKLVNLAVSKDAQGQTVMVFTGPVGQTLSAKAYQDVLSALSFNNTLDTPSTQTRSMTLVVKAKDGSTAYDTTQTLSLKVVSTDDAPTGSPSYTGVVQEGKKLTADVSGISDLDGALTWTYQWQWKNGSDWESLDTASSSTSTLFIEKGWAGRQLKLVVYAKDPSNNVTTLEKEVTDEVALNDRPVVSLSGVTTGQEPVFAEGGLAVQVDGGLNLSDLNGDLISEAVVQITDFRAGDVLGFTPATGITGTYDRTTGKLSFTSTTPLNIGIYKTLLQSVTYSSTSDDPTGNQSVAAGVVGAVAQGTRTISWTVKDLLGDANAVVPSSTVKITPINDAPTITVDTPVELKEDVKTQSSANYQLADVDGLASIDIGTMTGTDSTYGKWSLSTDGKKLTKAGSFGSVELDLEGKTLTYTLDNNKAETQALTANDRRAESFKVSVKDDQGQPASPAEVVFTVLGARDPINFALMSNAVTFTEMAGADTGANAVKIASGVTVKGDDVIQQLALTWVPLSGDQLWLNGVDLLSPMTDLSAGFTVGGKLVNLAVSKDAQGQTVMVFTGPVGQTLSAKAYQDVLSALSFNNTLDTPSTQTRSMTLVVKAKDGSTAYDTTQTLSLKVVSTDDAPTGSPSYTGVVQEGKKLTADVSGISDLDGALTWTYQWQWKNGSDWESLDTASSSTSTLFIEKGWAGRQLKLVVYAKDPSNNVTTLEKEVTDEVALNDRPVVSLSGVTTGQEPVFAEGGLAVQVDGGLNLSDLNGDLISEAVVQITDFRAGDVLGFTPATGITGTYDRTTGKLSFTSTTPLNIGIYKTLLQSVTYSSTSDDPTGNQSVAAGVVGAVAQGTRTISWTVKDLLGDANAVVPSSTVKITPINDAPTITVDTPVELKEDVKTQSSANYQLADVDGLASIDIGTMTGTDSTYGKWSLSTDGKKLTKAGSFGSVELDLEGKTLTYTLDNNKAETQALIDGEQRTETFRVSLKDDQGGTNNQRVDFKVNGNYDALSLDLAPITPLAFTEVLGTDDRSNAVLLSDLVPTIKGDDLITELDVTLTPSTGDELLNGSDNLLALVGQGTQTVTVGGKTVDLSVTKNTTTNAVQLSFKEHTGSTLLPADYITVLKALKFNNASDQPSTASRSVTVDLQTKDPRPGIGTTSAITKTFSIDVTGVNDRPVVMASQIVALATASSAALGAPIPQGQVGNKVKDLVAFFTDGDANSLKGLAITKVNAVGQLWYSTDAGSSWKQAQSLSNTSALVLSGEDDNARVFFRNFSATPGQVADALTVKAWDLTSGASGDTAADTTTSTAYSVGTQNVSITLSAPSSNATSAKFKGAVSGLNDVVTVSGLTYLDKGSNLSVAMADFNGDGKLDIYAPWSKTAQKDYLYLGASNAFTTKEITAGNVGAASSISYALVDQVIPRVTTVDFNNDDNLDIALMSGNGNASMLLNTGSLNFVNVGWATNLVIQRSMPSLKDIVSTTSVVGKGNERIAFADFNGDGFVDATVANATGSISFLTNTGKGRFDTSNGWQQLNAAVATGLGPMIWGDFTGDGVLDFFQGSNLLTNTMRMSVGKATGYSKSNDARYQGNGLGAFNQLINPTSLFTSTPTWADISGKGYLTAQSAAAADFDQDGSLDLFFGAGAIGNSTASTSSKGMLLRNNPGSGSFATSSTTTTPVSTSWLFDGVNASQGGPALQGNVVTAAWVDYNMDGWLDLITSETDAATGSSKGIYVYLSKGKDASGFKGFAAGLDASKTGLNIGTSAVAQGFNVGDVNQDGTPDLFVSTNQGSFLFLNDQVKTSSLALKVLGKVGSTPLYGAKVTVTQSDDASVKFTQFVEGDTGEGTNQGDLVFYGLKADKTYTVTVEAAFDKDSTAYSYNTTSADTGVNLVKVSAKFANLNPDGTSQTIRVNPADLSQVGQSTANDFAGWNPTVGTGSDALTVNYFSNSTMTIDPNGAQVYVGQGTSDVLSLTPSPSFGIALSSTNVTLVSKDSTGVTGYMGFFRNTSTNYNGANTNNLDSDLTNGTNGFNDANIKGGINFTGIDSLTFTSSKDWVIDNVGMSLKLGIEADRLFLTDQLLSAYSASRDSFKGLVYDGEGGTGDTLDFSNLAWGLQPGQGVHIRFSAWSSSNPPLNPFTTISGGSCTIGLGDTDVLATCKNFELLQTSADYREYFDFRGAGTNTVNSNFGVTVGNNDVLYGTVSNNTNTSTTNGSGDKFVINNNSKAQNVTIYNGGVAADSTGLAFAGNAAGNDVLLVTQTAAYTKITTTNGANGAARINVQTGSTLGGADWFTGTMDDVYEMTASNYTGLDANFIGLDHAIKFNLQGGFLDNSTVTDIFNRQQNSYVRGTDVTTAGGDTLIIGYSGLGTGNDTVESGRGDDTIRIAAGSSYTYTDPTSGLQKTIQGFNGKTTVVFGRYLENDALLGNGTDTINGFTMGNDTTQTPLGAGEDVLDFSQFGLTINQKADMDKYFKAGALTYNSTTGVNSMNIYFDATGNGSFMDASGNFNAAITPLVKLTGVLSGGAAINTWVADDLMWNLKLGNQVVI